VAHIVFSFGVNSEF